MKKHLICLMYFLLLQKATKPEGAQSTKMQGDGD